MPAPPTRTWSNPGLASFLEGRIAAAAAPVEASAATLAVVTLDVKDAYRQAAAVLVSFDPETLRPLGLTDAVDAYSALVDDVTAATAVRGVARWTLKPAVRRDALAAVQRGVGFQAALAANPDRPRTDVQRCFEHYLVGVAYPPLEERTASQLAHTIRVTEWLDGLAAGLPRRGDLEARLARARFLAPFAHLLAKGFAGRERELDTLRNYVGVQQAQTIVGQTMRYIDLWASTITGNPRRGPLVVWGPGGVGKSTIIARFVSEHTAQHELTPFPFVYLDFDSGSLGVTSIAPLLIQMCLQLEAQYPARAAGFRALRERVARLVAQPAPGAGSGEIAITRNRALRLERFEQRAIRRLGTLAQQVVDDVSLRGRVMPLLLVLDTFENVQQASEGQVRKIAACADALREYVRSLRVVVSGRNDVRALLSGTEDVEELPLADLDVSAAYAVLEKLGVTAEDERAYIFSLTGGNPLSLHLAAELSLKGTLERKVGTRLKFRAARLVRETLVQGMLYDRILFNIDDEDIKRLAHPGLALRYLTPAIIEDVLAEPCELALPTEPSARHDAVERLFQGLQRYASLVVPDGPGLRHRADVRRAMLSSLDQDKPGLVRRIDALAVAYHERHEAENPRVARAEEIYHRLRLNQPHQVIEQRWRSDVGELLVDSLGDLSVQSQLVLVELGVRSDLEGIEAVSLADADWERLAAAKAADLLRHGLIKDAEAILAERQTRSADGPMWLAEAQLASALGDWAGAQAWAGDAQRAATRTNDPRRLLYALLLGVVAAYKRRDFDAALVGARRAEEVAATTTSPAAPDAARSYGEPNPEGWPRALQWLVVRSLGQPSREAFDRFYEIGLEDRALQRDTRFRALWTMAVEQEPGQPPKAPAPEPARVDLPIFGVNDATTDDHRAR
jgi:hypothetical protein